MPPPWMNIFPEEGGYIVYVGLLQSHRRCQTHLWGNMAPGLVPMNIFSFPFCIFAFGEVTSPESVDPKGFSTHVTMNPSLCDL